LVENDGVLPEYDEMRSPHLDVPWLKETMPKATIAIWKMVKVFNAEATLNYAHVLNPVIFFGLGLILFFILLWVLTKNKWVALMGSFILTLIPPYLYRTLGGFADHESIGMFGFFAALLFFYSGIKHLEKKKVFYSKVSIWGLLAGLGTMFAIASWGGIGKFLFMILPLAFLIRWFTKGHKAMWKYVLFYATWFLGILISTSIFGYSIKSVITGQMLVPSGLLTFITFGYILIETSLLKFKILNKKLLRHKELISFGLIFVLGGIFYQVFVGNFFGLFSQLIAKVLNPFKGTRLAQTVAEQKAPFLTELVSQLGKTVFYTFLAACFIVGGKLASGIRNKKLRPLFMGSFAFFVIGILFSKYSPSSIFNGDNFISKALFFISFLAVVSSSIYIYRKSDWKIDLNWIFIAAWMVPMLLAVRSAIRVFFAIVPFVSLMVPLALFEIGKWEKKNKDDLLKTLSIVLVLALSILLIVTTFQYYKSVDNQAKYQTLSYNADWQKAMAFVRENTTEGGIFAHWWDYGYWVETGGNRPAFSDGGHSQGDFGNHIVGRYVLTTPYPETAKSFFKSNNISYLLIDPTDIGKYGAYSSIGTGKDIDDRSSWLVTLISNPSEIQETRNGTIRIYRGGAVLDDDLRYKDDTQDVFLPARKAGLGALILEKKNVVVDNQAGYIPSQPKGIYVYNNKQYTLPIRYMFINGELIDFRTGVNATVYVYANVYNGQAGQQIDSEGAAMYLSEKTKDSLVAKLYLMDDPEDEYSELELIYSKSPYLFPFYYGGFRGPIKIWDVDTESMDDILIHEEFGFNAGEFGLLDGYEFVRN
jgi:asparagine N-glycosylation enzyme membrane subunit Stt3